MMSRLDFIDRFMASPVIWGVLALLALAVSLTAKISVPASYVTLFIAFILICVGLREFSRPVMLVVAIVAALALIALGVWLRPSLAPSYYGILVPRSRPLVETLLSMNGDKAYKRRSIQIGTANAVFDYIGAEGTPLFTFFGDSHLTVERINGKIAVSTKIHDRNGNLVAEIFRNEWKIAPPPKTWDRNYNQDTLEVLDETGRVVLQVRALLDRVQIQGIWWGPNGYGAELVQPDASDPTKGGLILQFGPPPRLSPEDAVPIKQTFLYPSETHLGQLAK